MKATSSTSMSNLIDCIFKHLRNERFADQELVALRLGLSVSTISKIELGNVGISVESIFRLYNTPRKLDQKIAANKIE